MNQRRKRLQKKKIKGLDKKIIEKKKELEQLGAPQAPPPQPADAKKIRNTALRN